MRSLPKFLPRLTLVALAGLAAACVPEKPPNPFGGGWTTPEHHQIAFRDNTVVVTAADAAPTPMAAESCGGAFHFGYATKSRGALLGLITRQPDLRNRLATMLRQPDYPVAELSCGEGDSTYVLLDERDLVVIHRDHDIAGIERLTKL